MAILWEHERLLVVARARPGVRFRPGLPPGKETKTGYWWEPWHYRYVGKKNAKRLEESGMSLQEFLTREGALPRC